VRQACRREHLAFGALAVALGADQDLLEGNLAVQELIMGTPDNAEATGAETLTQAVAPEQKRISCECLLVTSTVRTAGDAPQGAFAPGIIAAGGLV
jgi:coproporphyrinogen III oxidase-like Fe-S oxidoreductase